MKKVFRIACHLGLLVSPATAENYNNWKMTCTVKNGLPVDVYWFAPEQQLGLRFIDDDGKEQSGRTPGKVVQGDNWFLVTSETTGESKFLFKGYDSKIINGDKSFPCSSPQGWNNPTPAEIKATEERKREVENQKKVQACLAQKGQSWQQLDGEIYCHPRGITFVRREADGKIFQCPEGANYLKAEGSEVYCMHEEKCPDNGHIEWLHDGSGECTWKGWHYEWNAELKRDEFCTDTGNEHSFYCHDKK